ncbi:hypothetical protein BKA64DRAFT_672210 [Cadophora sp. MPI-SDFR-AT-0126]|nr:hypothetical protein BKA64DRAFT_672210 [Leotiomycetes sp. MPI-SDFR-AT-0126]
MTTGYHHIYPLPSKPFSRKSTIFIFQSHTSPVTITITRPCTGGRVPQIDDQKESASLPFIPMHGSQSQAKQPAVSDPIPSIGSSINARIHSIHRSIHQSINQVSKYRLSSHIFWLASDFSIPIRIPGIVASELGICSALYSHVCVSSHLEHTQTESTPSCVALNSLGRSAHSSHIYTHTRMHRCVNAHQLTCQFPHPPIWLVQPSHHRCSHGAIQTNIVADHRIKRRHLAIKTGRARAGK